MKTYLHLLIITVCSLSFFCLKAQPVTGVWKGKIDRKNVELKIIKKGDSLTGTSYYYHSPNNYKRYSIRGYFDELDNSVIWWDEKLIEEKGGNRLFSKNETGYRSVADFNCPGGTKMFLNGKATLKDGENEPLKPVDLQKYEEPSFPDEWDYVINNYTTGGNDPELIDSVGQIAFTKPVRKPFETFDRTIPKSSSDQIEKKPIEPTSTPTRKQNQPPITKPQTSNPPPELSKLQPPTSVPVIAAAPLTNEQKFHSRSKQVVLEIPISGDSIEVNFYDNAIIDGDSIAIFLNNQLLAEHILLKEEPYTIKLSITALKETNDLVMVAENLGSIPPNTSLMIAYVDGKRYEARLESTEQSSAVIRFVQEKKQTF